MNKLIFYSKIVTDNNETLKLHSKIYLIRIYPKNKYWRPFPWKSTTKKQEFCFFRIKYNWEYFLIYRYTFCAFSMHKMCIYILSICVSVHFLWKCTMYAFSQKRYPYMFTFVIKKSVYISFKQYKVTVM